MVLMAKVDDYEVLRDFLIDLRAAERYKRTDAFMFNHANQVPPALRGELIQAIQAVMHLDCDRRDTCAPDVQIACHKANSVALLIIVRGCTWDLLKLEVAVKSIMYFAKKASPRKSRVLADLCLLYSPLAWKFGGRTNLDRLYLEDALTSPVISLDDVQSWEVDEIPSLNRLLMDSSGKHPLFSYTARFSHSADAAQSWVSDAARQPRSGASEAWLLLG